MATTTEDKLAEVEKRYEVLRTEQAALNRRFKSARKRQEALIKQRLFEMGDEPDPAFLLRFAHWQSDAYKALNKLATDRGLKSIGYFGSDSDEVYSKLGPTFIVEYRDETKVKELASAFRWFAGYFGDIGVRDGWVMSDFLENGHSSRCSFGFRWNPKTGVSRLIKSTYGLVEHLEFATLEEGLTFISEHVWYGDDGERENEHEHEGFHVRADWKRGDG